MIVVFTHMDTLTNKEMREELKRKRTEWLKYNLSQNEQVSQLTHMYMYMCRYM